MTTRQNRVTEKMLSQRKIEKSVHKVFIKIEKKKRNLLLKK